MKQVILIALALCAAYTLGTLRSPARADEAAREQLFRDITTAQRAQADSARELVRVQERQVDLMRDLVRATERCAK